MHAFLLYAQPSGWYNVSRNDLDRFGGKGLWRYYVSVEDLLKSNYPEYPWDVSKFIGAGRKNVPMGFWRDRNNIMYALEKAEEAIGIKKVRYWVVNCSLTHAPAQLDNSPRTGIRCNWQSWEKLGFLTRWIEYNLRNCWAKNTQPTNGIKYTSCEEDSLNRNDWKELSPHSSLYSSQSHFPPPLWSDVLLIPRKKISSSTPEGRRDYWIRSQMIFWNWTCGYRL